MQHSPTFFVSFLKGAETNFLNLKFEYLSEKEFWRRTILARLSGAQMGLIHEKNWGLKSRDTAPSLICQTLKPFDAGKRKVRRFSQNFYSLFFVIRWVQNFFRIFEISLSVLKCTLIWKYIFTKITVFKVLFMLNSDVLEFLRYLFKRCEW